MSDPSQDPQDSDLQAESPDFEEAVSRLEALVAHMESGEISLEELIHKFEEGTKLVKVCQNYLKHAEIKIENLKSSLSGQDVEPIGDNLPES